MTEYVPATDTEGAKVRLTGTVCIPGAMTYRSLRTTER